MPEPPLPPVEVPAVPPDPPPLLLLQAAKPRHIMAAVTGSPRYRLFIALLLRTRLELKFGAKIVITASCGAGE
jgi:hypothetical protein